MDADRLITAFIGAFLGAAGWLVVGLYMQRRQFDRQARAEWRRDLVDKSARAN